MSSNSASIGSNPLPSSLSIDESAIATPIEQTSIQKEKEAQTLPSSDLNLISPSFTPINKATPPSSFSQDVKVNLLPIVKSTNSQVKAVIKAQSTTKPTIGLTRATEGMQILNFILSIPAAITGTYHYAKNWKQMNAKKRAIEGATVIQAHVGAAEVTAFLVKSIPGVAQTTAVGANVAVSFLGPIAAGLGSILASIKSTQRGRTAHVANKNAHTISTVLKKETSKLQRLDQLTASILEREQDRFKNIRNINIMSSLKYALISVALGISATIGILTLAGVSIAVAASPAGWAAAGTLGAAALIGIGVYAYKKYKNKQFAQQEQAGLASALARNINIAEIASKISAESASNKNEPQDSVSSTSKTQEAVKDQVVQEINQSLRALDPKDLKKIIKTSADVITDEDINKYAEEILNTPTWPSGPTLLQNILESLEAQLKD